MSQIEARNIVICAARREGCAARTIAAAFDLSARRIYQILHAHGIS